MDQEQQLFLLWINQQFVNTTFRSKDERELVVKSCWASWLARQSKMSDEMLQLRTQNEQLRTQNEQLQREMTELQQQLKTTTASLRRLDEKPPFIAA
jgi:chromosome segregation ATPase